VRRRRAAGEQDEADRRRIPDTTTCTKPLEKGLWGLVSKLLTGAPACLPCGARDQRREEALLAVVNRKNGGRCCFHGSERGETTHLDCAGNAAICVRPQFGVHRSWGYEESNAGIWRYGAAAAAGIDPRPQSVTWRWPTLQTGQSGWRGSMTMASAEDGGKSPRQCWTILFRLRLDRNPKCRIFTNPLGSTCRRKRRMNSTASSDISFL